MGPIILIRHAQSEHHVTGTTGGWTDTDLTELGRRQARCLAARLKREISTSPCRLYCSDLKRALQTAASIGAAIGSTPESVPELREFNAGIASGMDRELAKSHYNKVTSPMLDWRPYPESESWGEFYNRVTSFMDKLSEIEECVLIVSHGGTIQSIIKWWIGTPLSGLFKVEFGTANTSVTVLDTTLYNERRIERLNDTSHYARIGRTNPIEYLS